MPLARKAAKPVKRPTAIIRPPKNSMIPPTSISGLEVICGPPKAPNSFCAPWQAKRTPETNRKRA